MGNPAIGVFGALPGELAQVEPIAFIWPESRLCPGAFNTLSDSLLCPNADDTLKQLLLSAESEDPIDPPEEAMLAAAKT